MDTPPINRAPDALSDADYHPLLEVYRLLRERLRVRLAQQACELTDSTLEAEKSPTEGWPGTRQAGSESMSLS